MFYDVALHRHIDDDDTGHGSVIMALEKDDSP